MSAIRLAAASALLLVLAIPGLPSEPALGQGGCSYVASLSGSDHARGTPARPFRTVRRLLDRLAPGQVGCVRGGTYRESITISHGGTSNSRRVTLQSYPGERATLVGRLYIRRRAPYVTIANMNLNGRNRASLPSPDIVGESDRFIGNDVTNEHTEICFILGSPGYGRAKDTLIEGNRIHDCGLRPSRNEDHGIYVADADYTRIVNNVIFNNTDRGVQLYPDAQGTVIEHNIIDENGENIAFGGERTSTNNSLVAFNLITNSTIGFDVQSYFPGGTPVGVNNVVRDNCIFGGVAGTVAREKGFTAANLGNKGVNPEYAAPASGNFSVPPRNRCAAYVLAGTPVKPF
jgi:parallel beta-helix repeat protein